MVGRHIVFAISMLRGGGAENAMLEILSYLNNKSFHVSLIITNQASQNVIYDKRLKGIHMYFLEDMISEQTNKSLLGRVNSAICRSYEFINKSIPDLFAEYSFDTQYSEYVNGAIEILKTLNSSCIVTFLQPTTQIMLKAAYYLKIPVVVSERSDPIRYLRTRYASFCFNKYYDNVRTVVFQTPYAMSCYPKSAKIKGVVIPNAIRNTLPLPYHGVREKKIVNYCRIAPEKNLKLLVDGFSMFRRTHQGYTLEIYGDGPCKDELIDYISKIGEDNNIFIYPHDPEIHQKILKYSMYVSTSNFEGLSNSMLEAMAIGLPTICTDCDGGGARFIIRNKENGILIPKNDTLALSQSMSSLADSIEMSKHISSEGSLIREKLKTETIMSQWEKVILVD